MSLPRKAKAESFNDAVITVGVSTGVGMVLGASTLPFYSVPTQHLKNMFYGAAIGAVVGVVLSASLAVKETPDLGMQDSEKNFLAQSSAELAKPKSILEQNPSAVWSPVATIQF